jgi:integrase
LRPYEVTRLNARAVDLHAGTILVVGKFNYAYESYRQLPIPRELIALVKWLLLGTEQSKEQDLNAPLIQMHRDNAYLPARLNDLQLVWEQAAIASGKLRSEQVPELGSLRHFYRTFALHAGFPHPAVNALMGHQSGGCELYHPYLNQDPHEVFQVGLRLASEIASSVHFEAKRVHLPA